MSADGFRVKYQDGWQRGLYDGRAVRSAPLATWHRPEFDMPIPRDPRERESWMAGYVAGFQYAINEIVTRA